MFLSRKLVQSKKQVQRCKDVHEEGRLWIVTYKSLWGNFYINAIAVFLNVCMYFWQQFYVSFRIWGYVWCKFGVSYVQRMLQRHHVCCYLLVAKVTYLLNVNCIFRKQTLLRVNTIIACSFCVYSSVNSSAIRCCCGCFLTEYMLSVLKATKHSWGIQVETIYSIPK